MLASDFDPLLQTESTPNLCLQLFSDRRGRSQLGTTGRGRPLGEDPRNQAEQIR